MLTLENFVEGWNYVDKIIETQESNIVTTTETITPLFLLTRLSPILLFRRGKITTLKHKIKHRFNHNNDRFVDLNTLSKVLDRSQETGHQYFPIITRGLDRLTNTYKFSMIEIHSNI
jgi:hypothetical protein